MNDKLGRLAIYCSASILPLTFLSGQLIGRILKHYNPARVNVHHELAYLRPIMLGSIITGLGVLVMSVILVLVARNKDKALDKYRIAAAIIGLQLGVVLLAYLLALAFPPSA